MSDCGCRIETTGEYNVEHQGTDEVQIIVYCPMHQAAPELVEACQKMYYALQIGHNDYTEYGAKAALRKAGVQD